MFSDSETNRLKLRVLDEHSVKMKEASLVACHRLADWSGCGV